MKKLYVVLSQNSNGSDEPSDILGVFTEPQLAQEHVEKLEGLLQEFNDNRNNPDYKVNEDLWNELDSVTLDSLKYNCGYNTVWEWRETTLIK